VSEIKVGDEVWVLCKVVEPCESLIKVTPGGDDNWFWAGRGQCRTVELPNCLEIPNSSSEPIKVGDAVRFVSPEHKHHSTEGTIVLIEDSLERRYSFESNCGHIKGLCTIAELERINQADAINPSHYKQGGIECIEAIKAATGDGFVGYVWGNVIKYLWRWPNKGGVEDLKKARWYLDRLIKEVGE
jgi:hypothetical protein